MKLEGVIVSVDYADLLAEALPLNRHQFDDLVVVTAPEDVETQRICGYYGVRHIQTDVLRTRWAEMHKAKGINAGLKSLKQDGWVLHMDADIVLPPKTRELLERADLDPTLLYGCDRFNVPGYEAWRTHQAMPALQQDNYHVHLDVFPLAARFAGQRMGGYAPPGFFQLWHPEQSHVTEYPAEHSDASRTDVLFSSRWWRRGRALLPEFVVYHLESEPAAQGANWGGRTTCRWGPEPWCDHHHPRHHRQPPDHRDHHHPDGHWHHRDHRHHHCPGPYGDQDASG